MEKRKRLGLLERLYVAITLTLKTAKANISAFLSSRKTVLLPMKILTFVLCSMSAGVLLLGSAKILNSSAAVDYSKPVQKLSYYWANVIQPSNMSTVQNNWRQTTSYRNMPADVDLSSFRLSAYATNNWGNDFDIWFTIIAEDTGEVIYNSGWKTSPIINEPVYMYRTYSRVRCIMRVRYSQELVDAGYTNPPSDAQFSGVNWVINYDYYVNYSTNENPPGWNATTTAAPVEIPETVLTTTSYIDWDSQVKGDNGVFNYIRESIATIFGITDSWESCVVIMNYMNAKMPYVYAISLFCGITGIAVWFLEK